MPFYFVLNPLSAGPDYICVFYPIKYQVLNTITIKRDINQNISKSLTSILRNPNNFHTLEVVARVSETQLQVSANSD